MINETQKVDEILSHIWKSLQNRAKKGGIAFIKNLQVPTSSHPNDAKSKPRPHKKSTKSNAGEKRPRQLSLGLKIPKPRIDFNEPPFYKNPKNWFEDNFTKEIDDSIVYIGPDLSHYGFTAIHGNKSIIPGGKIEYPLPFLEDLESYMNLWNESMKKKIIDEWELKNKHAKAQKLMNKFSLDEIKSVIDEVVSEELDEINGTIDDRGKSIAAVGAPDSVARFETEHPELILGMREWVKDCQWADIDSDSDVDELSTQEILIGVQHSYDGGIKAFIRDSNSTAQSPTGYKEGVGYVSDKDMKKDPKHIKGERWRIKFQSDSDLKKHGNTEMSSINESSNFYIKAQYAQNDARKKQNAEAMIYYAQLMGLPKTNQQSFVSYNQFKATPAYVQWKQKHQSDIDLQIKRFQKPWLEGKLTTQDIKSVIRELIDEMWTSKDDVTGDEGNGVGQEL